MMRLLMTAGARHTTPAILPEAAGVSLGVPTRGEWVLPLPAKPPQHDVPPLSSSMPLGQTSLLLALSLAAALLLVSTPVAARTPSPEHKLSLLQDGQVCMCLDGETVVCEERPDLITRLAIGGVAGMDHPLAGVAVTSLRSPFFLRRTVEELPERNAKVLKSLLRVGKHANGALAGISRPSRVVRVRLTDNAPSPEADGDASGSAGLRAAWSDDDVYQALKAAIPGAVMPCFIERIATGTTLAGALGMMATIDTTATMRSPRVRVDSLGDRAMIGCILSRLDGLELLITHKKADTSMPDEAMEVHFPVYFTLD